MAWIGGHTSCGGMSTTAVRWVLFTLLARHLLDFDEIAFRVGGVREHDLAHAGNLDGRDLAGCSSY
jgi:hypothetical protein